LTGLEEDAECKGSKIGEGKGFRLLNHAFVE
jgi:hypothetical protein